MSHCPRTLREDKGMEGLPYAFRAMGAQSTLSTLWPVADDASGELMRAFYRNLRDGDPKDIALRQAQLRFLREHPERASPFFWAPPVLHGSPMALPFEESLVPVWAWWSLLALFGITILASILFWVGPCYLPSSAVPY